MSRFSKNKQDQDKSVATKINEFHELKEVKAAHNLNNTILLLIGVFAFFTLVYTYAYPFRGEEISDDKTSIPPKEVLAEKIFNTALAATGSVKIKLFKNVCETYSTGDACKKANKYLDAFNSEEHLIISELDSGSQCKLSMWQGSKNDADNSKREIDSLSQINSSEEQAGSAKNRTESYLFQIDTVTGQNACSQAITDFPDDPEYQYLLGRVHHAKFEYYMAADYYKKAALDGYGKAYAKIGFLYGGGKLDNGDSNVEKAMKWFTLGANKGFDEAKIAKAYYLQYGFEGVEQDTETAKTLLIEVYNKKSPKAALSLGKFYEKGFAKDGGKTTAFDYYRDAANWGETDGLIRQADMLFNGDLAPSSKKQDQDAVDLIKDAIELDDNPWAYHFMGWAYANGRGLSQDNAEAIKFYKKAIERNYGYSAISISQAYSFGRLGLEKNLSELLHYHNIALDLGENDALLYRANLFFYGIFQPISDDADKQANILIDEAIRRGTGNWGHRLRAWAKLYGRGVPKNEEKARTELIKLYEKRKSGGAALIMGNIYRDGLGVVADIEKAKGYYEKAELLGWSQGRVNRAWLLLNGIEKPISSTNDLVAFKLFSQNENEQNSNILLGIGYLYEMGIGVHKDLAKAYKYYQQAYELGNSTAASNLGNFFRTGFREQKPSPEKALNYFRRAIDWGYFDAYGDIADMLYDGEIFADADGEIVFEKPKNIDDDILHKRSENAAFQQLMKGHEWAPKNSLILSWIAWAYENGRGVEKNLSQALKYRRLAAENGHNYSRRWLATKYLEGEILAPSWPDAKKFLTDASKNGDVSANAFLLAISSGANINGYNSTIELPKANCSESLELYVELLTKLGKQRKVNGVRHAIYNELFKFDIDGIDEAYQQCGILYNLPISEGQFNMMFHIFKSNNFENNIYALKQFTPTFLGNGQAGKVSDAKQWLLQSLSSEILIDDTRAYCLKNQILHEPLGVTLTKYVNNHVRLSEFCPKLDQLHEMIHFGDYDLSQQEKDTVQSLSELQNFLSQQDNALAESIYVSLKDEMLNEAEIANIIGFFPISSKYAISLAIKSEKSESDIVRHWSGEILAWNMIFGRQEAEDFLVEYKGSRQSPFWRGVHGAFSEVCAMPEDINWNNQQFVEESFVSGIIMAQELGHDARTRDDPNIPDFNLLDPHEEHWTHCN